MQFIKNKTTHTVKWLITSSSVLILNGNACTSKTLSSSHQKALQPDSAYSSIISSPEKKQETIEKLAALEDAFKKLASNSQAVRRLLSQGMSSIPNPPFDGTYNNPIDAVPSDNNKKEAIYAEPIDANIKDNQINKDRHMQDHSYATIGKEQPEEHIYAEINEEQTTEL
ncbi:hypothetical protein [Candidatus Cardinium hertigii]|uniref:hypothetical protein n=1 Tax=Candidatus Cardinium hertigii TaxID=247481 RepID=UPI003D7DF77A